MTDNKETRRVVCESKIMEAAEFVFANSGYKGASIEVISQKADIPKSNVLYYFNTKEALYRRVLERILNEWIEAGKIFDDYDEPKIALTKYVESKMIYSRIRPYASKVWATEMIHGAPMVGEFLETTLSKWLDDRVTIIRRWIKSGLINRVNPTALIYMIWSVTQHYADFEGQMEILNKGNKFTDREYKYKTNQVITLILASVGLQK